MAFNREFSGSLNAAADEIAWRNAIGWDITIDSCVVTSPELTNFRVSCAATHQNDWSRSLGFDPYPGAEFSIRVADQQLTEVFESPMVTEAWVTFPGTEFVPEVWNPFMSWLEKGHPSDIDAMLLPPQADDASAFLPGLRKPIITPESIALWEQYTAEFVAEVG